MSLWSYFTGPALTDDGAPVKTRAQKLDDQLGRIEADLLRLKSKLDLADRRVERLEAKQTDDGTRQPWGVVEIVSKGNLANRMIQFMTAVSIIQHAKGGRIAGAQLREWQIDHTVIPNDGQQTTRDNGQWVPVQRLGKMLRECLVERVVLDGYCQNVDNFLGPEAYRDFFTADPNIGRETDADSLLISVRGDEILTAPHEDYVLIPVEFYADIIAQTGLKPVFMGQLTPSPYMDALRARFPDARYLESMGAPSDFATILKAKNIVVSVSTFSWLAAWLSNATQIILPLNGLLNPFQSTSQDFVPKHDPRYKFFLFAINYAVPVNDYKPVHDALDGRWKQVSAEEVTILRGQVPTQPRKIMEYLALFDEEYYLRFWGDVQEGVSAGWLKSARSHFSGPGFAENRRAFDLDHKFYSVAYPDSAAAIAEGQYIDFWHYHASVGHAAGNALRGPP